MSMDRLFMNEEMGRCPVIIPSLQNRGGQAVHFFGYNSDNLWIYI